VYSRTATKGGHTGFAVITGDTPDISEWLDFTFYDWVGYWHPPNAAGNPHSIGRWLGVSHRVGSALCYWILTAHGNVIARTTVQHITQDKMQLDETKAKLGNFSESLRRCIGDGNFTTDMDGLACFINDDKPNAYSDVIHDEEIFPPRVPNIDEVVDSSDVEKAADMYHSYLGAEVVVPDTAGVQQMARVIKQIENGDRPQAINPLLDTSVFEVVEYMDGTIDRLNTNIIAENLMSQVDPYAGHHFQVLQEIIEHQKDGSAIPVENGFIQTRLGNLHQKKTTRG
jgi:hypothetical protein